jgi:phosphorylase kinase alpha/beta subunit
VYGADANTHMLAQEIVVHLGTLVRTDMKLFVEMFRLRIGLIIQVCDLWLNITQLRYVMC